MNFEYERYYVHSYWVKYGMFGVDFEESLPETLKQVTINNVINPLYPGNP